MEIKYFENVYGANHYERQPIIIKEASGCWVTDVDDNRYLDCLAAYSAANQGHSHPRIVDVAVRSLRKSQAGVISNVVYNESAGEFLKKLCNMLPALRPGSSSYSNKALLKNAGTESVETAIKTMRHVGWKKGIEDGKQEIIVFDNNFHGRMTTVISFSSTDKYKEGFGPLTPGFVRVPYDNLDAVKAAVNKNTCGILVEPMQGEGGMRIPSPGFLKGLRKISDENDLFLVFDEIQVGLGRTGKMFCFEHENIIPDGIILGKAISGGLVPLSAFVTDKDTMDSVFTAGKDGSTFGGYPYACIVGLEALKVIEEESLAERSAKKGAYLLKEIQKLYDPEVIKDIRGRGLFIGIEVKNGNAMEYCRKLLKLGVLTNDSHGHTIRISPPLTINDNEIWILIEALSKVLL